jgi:GNAT superfamily N-acetyltransferase
MPQLTVAGRTFDLRRASPDEIVDLRWRILRAGLPRDAAMFPGDEAETSFHYAAIENHNASCGGNGASGARVVSCATIHLNEWESEPAYQLRGMATEADCRSFGLGRRLLELAEADVQKQTPIRLLWCNARTPALGFYQKQGWQVRSDVFEIPTAGPHVRMTKRI